MRQARSQYIFSLPNDSCTSLDGKTGRREVYHPLYLGIIKLLKKCGFIPLDSDLTIKTPVNTKILNQNLSLDITEVIHLNSKNKD